MNHLGVAKVLTLTYGIKVIHIYLEIKERGEGGFGETPGDPNLAFKLLAI